MTCQDCGTRMRRFWWCWLPWVNCMWPHFFHRHFVCPKCGFDEVDIGSRETE